MSIIYPPFGAPVCLPPLDTNRIQYKGLEHVAMREGMTTIISLLRLLLKALGSKAEILIIA